MSNIAQKCIESKSNVVSRRGALNERGVTTMNPITVFLTVACLLVGAGFGRNRTSLCGHFPVADLCRSSSPPR